MPYNIYKPFRGIYATWLEIQGIFNLKVDDIITQVRVRDVSKNDRNSSSEQDVTSQSVLEDTSNKDSSNSSNLGEDILKRWDRDCSGQPNEVLAKHLKDPVPLANICSACYGDNPRPTFAVVCIDGCMQQKRWKYTMQEDPEYEYRNKLLFVDDDVQNGDDISDVTPSLRIKC